MGHNFQLVNADTDSITVCKQDQSEFSKEEQESLLAELNSLFPKGIHWEDDGDYKKIIVLKAKNYVLLDRKDKLKYKGSAIKATQKEPALKEFIKAIIDSMLNDRNDYQEIYHRYVKEAANIKDIKRWAARKTVSERTLNSERKNETRIKDAIEGTEIVEGDRIYLYNKDEETLDLVQNFDGTYCVAKYLKKVYDTSWTFDSVLDCDALFINYTLKKNKKALEDLLKNE
jgi:hypothetical protein